jgi:uncharacterized membrane protein YagU involved in acid resistance
MENVYNSEALMQLAIFASIIAPIVAALVEGVKKSTNLPKNILPAVALIIGLAVGLLSQPFTELGLYIRLWAGAFAGLTAVGLFEIVKFRSGFTKE